MVEFLENNDVKQHWTQQIRHVISSPRSELSKNPLTLAKNTQHPQSWELGMRRHYETRRTNGT